MRYGCIGEKLGHSFSRQIHGYIGKYPYELCEVAREELDGFMTERNFLGINVTIPYKERVIPYLDYVDESAREIGAVNTVVNKNGKLHGYNTDFYGMMRLIAHAGIELSGKTVAILGTGGTSKTAVAVSRALTAGEILRVSRCSRDGCITYNELSRRGYEIDVIINTTPVGMYPDNYSAPVNISDFPNLCGVIDAIYNPLRSTLVSDARKRQISAEGGLYMLVAQAARASEIFFDTSYPDVLTEQIYEKMLKLKENIVLIGMPSSGKSTVGGILAKKLGRVLLDTDELIVRQKGCEITEIFSKEGESGFRDAETVAIRTASAESGVVIATGGGAVLRDENVSLLRQNGRLYFLDRPLCELTPTDTRPLASDLDAIRKRYSERYSRYCEVADEIIVCDVSAAEVADKIGGSY